MLRVLPNVRRFGECPGRMSAAAPCLWCTAISLLSAALTEYGLMNRPLDPNYASKACDIAKLMLYRDAHLKSFTASTASNEPV